MKNAMNKNIKEAKKNIKRRGLRRIYLFFLALLAVAAAFIGMTSAEYNTRKIGFENDDTTHHYLQDVMQRVVHFTDQWLGE